ncbi:venom carboxylesterase-6 [Spodoptera frugiperda]|uniref:Carboxylic ester hydrolase n=4 Tax=Spodoptera frugiperda TaxID=7108 RepID=A0A9R0E0B4_SPOFR|nr:venom carboxylesterase-6 [Spodoptera frugiperda]
MSVAPYCSIFKIMSLKLFLFLTVVGLVAAQGPNPTLRVAHGLLQGAWKVSTKGRSYASFQGVPYARPPIGKYRFREPQQLKPWLGVWDASRPLPGCLQYDPFVKKITGSENCLYVNVYTPKMNPGANLPVVVFIHGGAFMYGEGGIYNPSNLMDWDMVVVTLNYRLGPLGFLSTGDEFAPGNMGLKDQSYALHWIKNNILMFGGNPDSITLTGCSAGGASVHYHYLSPLSRGTFNRGIAFSGSALSEWTHSIKPAEKAKALSSIVGCPTNNNKEMMDCLKYRPAEAIVNAQIDMFEWKVHMFTPFTPVVEPRGVREPFLQQYPYHATRGGQMMNVPLIASVTSEEGLYPGAVYQQSPDLLPDLEAHWNQLAANIFEYNDTLPLNRRDEVAQKIKQHYLGGKPVSQETFPQLIQALSDRLFMVDVGKMAQIHAAKSGQPTYVYRYAFRGTSSLSNLMAHNEENYGVSHGDDVLSIFSYPGMVLDEKDAAMIEGLINMIYSYSTTGTPKLTNSAPVWEPVKPNSPELNYLDILSPTHMEMKASSDFGQKAFWDSLGLNENENYREYLRDEL